MARNRRPKNHDLGTPPDPIITLKIETPELHQAHKFKAVPGTDHLPPAIPLTLSPPRVGQDVDDTSPLPAPTFDQAIEARLIAGERPFRPYRTVRWNVFEAHIREDLGATKTAGGFSPSTLERAVRKIRRKLGL